MTKAATIHDYLAMLYRGRWIILSTFVGLMTVIVYYTFTRTPIYQASTTIMIDEKSGMGQALFELGGYSSRQTLINNQVEILKSRSLAQAVIERLLQSPHRDSLQILDNLGAERTMQDVVDAFQGSIIVTPIRNTDLIAIKAMAPSPFEASYLARSIARAYQEKDQAFSQGEISQVVDFLVEQLDRKEKELKASEEALKTFLEREKIASLSEEASQIVEQGAEFESLYRGALIDEEVSHKRLEFLKSQLGKSKETLEEEIARVSSPLVLKLRKEIAEMERTVAVYLSQGVGESDPQVRRERRKLKAIKDRLTQETRKLIVDGLSSDDPLADAQDLLLQIIETEIELESVKARADGLKRVVRSYGEKLESLPDKHVQLARLERSRKVDENLYMMMREKFEESRITQAGQIGKVRILDDPVMPTAPISPKKRLNMILGIFVSLGLGVGLTFLREYLDITVRRIEDIEALGMPVLAAIPEINTPARDNYSLPPNGRTNGKAADARIRLVTHFKPKSPVSEAYRTLRTNLQFSDAKRQLRSILVTSPGPGEGKSTTAANLAIAISLQGTRTIIVDADLRRPVTHRIFGLEKSRGLTNVLVGNLSLEEAVQPSQIQNLDILTSGILPPNPAELMGSERMADLIRNVKSKYEIVLFDSPPLIAVTDAAVLSKQVDGVLLVVNSGQTHRDALIRGVELLQNVNARILGVLLNGVSRENTYGSYYYYYYYHYYYYYGEGGDKKKRRPTGNHAIVHQMKTSS
ncbi:MAG: GumC family protein [bacterium]